MLGGLHTPSIIEGDGGGAAGAPLLHLSIPHSQVRVPYVSFVFAEDATSGRLLGFVGAPRAAVRSSSRAPPTPSLPRAPRLLAPLFFVRTQHRGGCVWSPLCCSPRSLR